MTTFLSLEIAGRIHILSALRPGYVLLDGKQKLSLDELVARAAVSNLSARPIFGERHVPPIGRSR